MGKGKAKRFLPIPDLFLIGLGTSREDALIVGCHGGKPLKFVEDQGMPVGGLIVTIDDGDIKLRLFGGTIGAIKGGMGHIKGTNDLPSPNFKNHIGFANLFRFRSFPIKVNAVS